MNTYIIEGGIGKQVAFSAIIDALVKKDKEKIQILSPYVDIFGGNTNVKYALDANNIATDFEDAGFKLLEMRPYGGLKGFKDEMNVLKPVLQPIFDNQNIFVKAIKILLDFALQPFAAHTTLFV